MAVMGQNESKAPVVSAKELDREFLPRHVAIIMDGNGRWAQKRGMPRPIGPKAGGEAQRVKLATELSRRSTGRTIYILDEPTTGLHFADVHKLVDILQKLTDGGNTVLVIEHNLDVIKTADYLIDLGPEGGDQGGQVIATGTPEEVAAVPGSYTGFFLKPILQGRQSV